MSKLSQEGVVDFAYGIKSSMAGGEIPMDKMDVGAIPDGLAYGLPFMTRDDPNVFEPLKLSRTLFLRFSKESDDDPRARCWRQLLDPDPAKYSFGIVDTGSSGAEQQRSESGRLSHVMVEGSRMSEIILNNRSMMEVLLFASILMEVPEEQISSHVARSERTIGVDWLSVHSSNQEPTDAWVKIR